MNKISLEIDRVVSEITRLVDAGIDAESRANRAEAQLAVEQGANEKLRQSLKLAGDAALRRSGELTAEKMGSDILQKAREDAEAERDALREELGQARETNANNIACAEEERRDLRRTLEGLLKAAEGVANPDWLGRHVGWPALQAALTAARGERKPEQPLTAEELQAEADYAADRDAELAEMGLQAKPLTLEEAEKRVRAKLPKATISIISNTGDWFACDISYRAWLKVRTCAPTQPEALAMAVAAVEAMSAPEPCEGESEL